MKKKTYNLIIAVLSAVILLGGSVLMLGGCSEAAVEETEPVTTVETTVATEPVNLAPDFTFTDAEGNSYTLADFRGKPVLLNFWATWCGPCKAELPEFEEAYLEYGDRVQFIMVDMVEGRDETVENGLAYFSEQGYTLPLFFDTNEEAIAAYSLTGFPTTCFISAEGELVSSQLGMLDAETLLAGIESILSE